MQKTLELAAVAVRAGACILFIWGQALGQSPPDERPPVKRVVVYDSGVAFIEHEGAVKGAKELTLELPDRDVNDLLKSMVVQDLQGGRVSWAALPTSTSKSPPVQLNSRAELTELLQAMRGMRVRIGAAAPVEGELLLVEKKTNEKTKEVLPQATLLTEAGMVRVDVQNGDAVQLLDEPQRRAMRRSAELLDTTFDWNSTKIRLRCEGEGDRQVRVGYVCETPIWKASYRLVLREEGKSLLQAWALVENATPTDWNDVECTLVSGRGLGFRTDLRTPLTIKRPYRAPERFTAIAPETHKPSEPSPLPQQTSVAGSSQDDPTDSLAYEARIVGKGGMGGMSGMGMGGMGGMGGAPLAEAGSAEMGDLLNRRLGKWREEARRTSVAQSAQQGVLDSASTLGESVRYQLQGVVSVKKGETALLHLMDAELRGREISIFNPSVDPVHPLHAVAVANPTLGALASGPVSIFSGEAYRGDALVDHWPAGDRRILSYAIDTSAAVRWESEPTPLEYLGVFVSEQGEVIFVARESLKGAYRIENRAAVKKAVWIEHPRFRDWTLSEPKEVAETAVDRYRIEQVVEPQREAVVPVALSRIRLLWPAELAWRLDEKEKAALPFMTESVQKLLKLEKEHLAWQEARESRYFDFEEKWAELRSDQERLRETIKTLEKFPEQVKPFIDRLIETEAKLNALRKENAAYENYAEGLEEDPAEVEARKALEAAVSLLVPQIRLENPVEKLPYRPTDKEIQSWRQRIQLYDSAGLGSMGGMGGMGGFF